MIMELQGPWNSFKSLAWNIKIGFLCGIILLQYDTILGGILSTTLCWDIHGWSSSFNHPLGYSIIFLIGHLYLICVCLCEEPCHWRKGASTSCLFTHIHFTLGFRFESFNFYQAYITLMVPWWIPCGMTMTSSRLKSGATPWNWLRNIENSRSHFVDPKPKGLSWILFCLMPFPSLLCHFEYGHVITLAQTIRGLEDMAKLSILWALHESLSYPSIKLQVQVMNSSLTKITCDNAVVQIV
jgi:hypothetical protein